MLEGNQSSLVSPLEGEEEEGVHSHGVFTFPGSELMLRSATLNYTQAIIFTDSHHKTLYYES